MKTRPPQFLASIIILALPWACHSLAEGVPQYQVDEESATIDVCMTCHGTYGQGNPAVGGPSLAGLEPWYLGRQLQLFRDGLRGSQRDYIPGYEMRETARSMSDEQINNLSLYISNWEPVAPESTLEGDIQHGQQLYTSCAACHGISGEGNEALSAPGLADRNDWYLLKQLKLFKSGYRGSHPDDTAGRQMRDMIQVLESEQDMIDVLSFINTL